jgi:tRNA pseudouridine13 synthase
MDLPYQTDFPGIGGVIKQRPEDFFVQEIPLYEACGEGEHVYCEVQKVGLTTFDALHRLARVLGVHTGAIGYAGMKDARAVTRQVFSIAGVTEERVMAAPVAPLTILWARRHGNKLRLGHLRGNRFAVKVRQVDPAAVVKVRAVLDELQRRGMPNYYGEQRFGRRGDNHLLGAALLAGNHRELLHHLLGRPDPSDDAQSAGARKAFDRGDLQGSMHLWPRSKGVERRALHQLIKTGRPGRAVRVVDEKLRRLWVSAIQSHLFNQVLARRLGTLDRVLAGDLAYKHANGACFHVEDVAAEQPRAEAFEISPTGPLLGYRMTLPRGEPLEIEQAVFAAAGLKPEDFRVAGRLRVKGTRRPLRVRPEDVELAAGADEHGPHITLAFTLPAGSFATVLLREIMKVPDPEMAAGGLAAASFDEATESEDAGHENEQ